MEVDGISMAHIHVAEAKDILQQLGLPTAQTDERFFDLIVVDECHRGSAAEDAAWRKQGFEQAVHELQDILYEVA
jgi:type I site-specific restriction endonuclease